MGSDDQFIANYTGFLRRVHEYVTAHNSLYLWSPSPRVVEKEVPDRYKNITLNNRIQRRNIIVKELLQQYSSKPEVGGSDRKEGSQPEVKGPGGGSRGSRTPGMALGLDLYALSLPLGSEWYLDAVHHVDTWYRFVSFRLLKRYCALVNLDMDPR